MKLSRRASQRDTTLKEYEVAGHRADTHVLVDIDGDLVGMPAEELFDAEGNPIYPDLEEQRSGVQDNPSDQAPPDSQTDNQADNQNDEDSTQRPGSQAMSVPSGQIVTPRHKTKASSVSDRNLLFLVQTVSRSVKRT